MASTVPLLLNRGIDLVTPPLLSEAGTLIDSLNYEMSADVGYHRWDGYERRDGYPTGGFSRWYSFTAGTLGDPFSNIVVGDILFTDPSNNEAYIPVGIVVALGTSNRIDYIPFDSNHKLFLGQSIFRYDSVGFAYQRYAVATSSVDGRVRVPDPETYLTTTRSYQTIIRAMSGDASTAIAGLFYSRDRSYEAVDTPFVQIASSGPFLIPGEFVAYDGLQYIFLRQMLIPNGSGSSYAYLSPTGNTATPVNTNLVGQYTGTSKPTGGVLYTSQSEYAYLTWLSFPGIFTVRGRHSIRPSLHYTFINGTFPGSANGPVVTPATTYYVTSSGGGTLLFQGTISQINLNTGGWVAGTATGRADFRITSAFASGQYFQGGSNMEVHTAFPVGAGTRLFTVNSNSTVATLAGTGALHRQNTRYQWGTYNFFADVQSTQLYGVNGVYRAFYGDYTGYSNIYTQEDEALDNPKYLTFHAGTQLGLGFNGGSFQLSVGGVPTDFEGVRGALEIGTGDDITGVLEGANDSSLIFGRRSIRRVTGTTDNTLALETISANAGAFNYTAVNVGATPVFTGITGVSTLEQVQQYGDFVGQRATSAISTWLVPKLAPTEGGLELAGVACALPVRNKQQYRLFLNSGDVVTITFTTEGPKVMKGSYKQPGFKPVVPLAWSSAVGDDGVEHVEVVWDRELAKTAGLDDFVEALPLDNRAYRLDNGWGFDGQTFSHWFDVTYTFVNNGTVATRVEKVRMYGMGYGVATLDLKASGIETDFKLPFSSRIQPINMPTRTQLLSDNMEPVTGIVDHQNWGYGIKLRINGTKAPLLTTTEPSHICQVLVLHLDETGANDN